MSRDITPHRQGQAQALSPAAAAPCLPHHAQPLPAACRGKKKKQRRQQQAAVTYLTDRLTEPRRVHTQPVSVSVSSTGGYIVQDASSGQPGRFPVSFHSRTRRVRQGHTTPLPPELATLPLTQLLRPSQQTHCHPEGQKKGAGWVGRTV